MVIRRLTNNASTHLKLRKSAWVERKLNGSTFSNWLFLCHYWKVWQWQDLVGGILDVGIFTSPVSKRCVSRPYVLGYIIVMPVPIQFSCGCWNYWFRSCTRMAYRCDRQPLPNPAHKKPGRCLPTICCSELCVLNGLRYTHPVTLVAPVCLNPHRFPVVLSSTGEL